MKLSDHLVAARTRIPLTSATKDDALRELVTLLGKGREASDAILEAVLEREQRMSTGIGRGVAIPHGKCPQADGLEISFGISAQPVEYGSLDGEPVRVFFLLISPPDQTGPHIRALAQISRMLTSDTFLDELLEARDGASVLGLIAREEAQLEEPEE